MLILDVVCPSFPLSWASCGASENNSPQPRGLCEDECKGDACREAALALPLGISGIRTVAHPLAHSTQQ